MKSAKTMALASFVKDFIERNKKLVICFCAVFALGIAVGIITVINEYGNAFERIPRSEMEFGGIKVFFISSFFITLIYGILLISSMNCKTVYIAVIPFLALGLYFGKYICMLIACYQSVGILNILLIYTPFFLGAFLLCGIGVIRALGVCDCAGGRQKLKPSFIMLLKFYGINILFNFTIFIIIGSMVGVVIVVF